MCWTKVLLLQAAGHGVSHVLPASRAKPGEGQLPANECRHYRCTPLGRGSVATIVHRGGATGST